MEALGYKIAVIIFALQDFVEMVISWRKRPRINHVICASLATTDRSRHVYLAEGGVEGWCAGG
jgi:hypothetical protein